ncbi:MAG TPA: hypothetical protein VFI12_03540 [Thermomicrobiales bacterium]|nr:hypothetical protein [Thermomicrobiales bacterium]
MSDERRDADQLAATFSDPADALSRLNAYCWFGQAERVYFNAREQLTIDVSIHDFSGSEGATLAQRWFGYQRANDLHLQQEVKTRAQLEEELNDAGLGKVNIETLDDVVIYALYNGTEYTLYARRDPDTGIQNGSPLPSNILVRVSVSGGTTASGMSRQVVAYQILADIFGVDLFPPRE